MPTDSTTVTAAVSLEDVRRKFYEANGYSMWIREVQLDPLQLIIDDDATGDVFRMSIGLKGSDITFGERVKVAVEYVDASARHPSAVTYASRAESLAGMPPVLDPAAQVPPAPAPTPPPPATPKPAVTAAEAAKRMADAARRATKPPTAKPAAGSVPTEREGSGMDLAKLRKSFGLSDDLSDDEVTSLLAEAGIAVTASTTPTGSPPDSADDDDVVEPQTSPVKQQRGVLLVEASAWKDREERLRKLELKEAGRLKAEGESVIAAAVAVGKFAPARVAYWQSLWNADPEGTRETLNGLAAGLIPTRASGYQGNPDEDMPEEAEFSHLFPPTVNAGGR